MNGKMRLVAIILLLALGLWALSACGGSPDIKDRSGATYKDGVYTGKSVEDDKGAYGEATITVEGGEIAGCEYVTWQKDGTVKDENYGKVNGEISNQEYYDKAQLAVDAMKQYAEQFAETKELGAVDTVSGATNSYNQFTEAVDDALDKAIG
jgi:major membrane immunogen (membrane-anchored lipoprotein)